MNYINIFLALFLGALSWTLTEYILHRFFGHFKIKYLVRTRFHKEHSKHHLSRHYFASNGDKLLTLLVTVPVVYFFSNILTSAMLSMCFTASFVMMYLAYELIHLRMHIKAPPHLYASKMRAHHFYHHFIDENMNHGVTTPIWDYVFGTFQRPSLITYPEKFRLRWLKVDDSGFYKDKWGQEYRELFCG